MFANGVVIEFSMLWDDVTNNNDRPAAFNWFGYKLYNNGPGNNGMYAPVPQNNPTSPLNAVAELVNNVYPVYYYSVVNTDNGTATAPFAARSFTYHQDVSTPGAGGYVLIGPESFFDFTVNDNSTDNNDNAPVNHLYDNNEIANRVLINGSLTVTRNLVVGQGSALLPADNTSGPVLSTLTLNGSNSHIYNEGRIDSNPEIGGTDYNLRRLSWVMDGNVTYEASSLFKELARFSDITITSGSTFHGPAVGSAQIELQYGSLTNHGELDFSDANGGTLDIGTRGDVSSPNLYSISNPMATGSFVFNDILIGRDTSTLAAAPSGGLIQLVVKGNFENYGDFRPSNVGSSISVKMNGEVRQEIRGNSVETLGNRTTFHTLIIENNNLLNDSNALADVHFMSFGGDEVDYFITDTLRLVSGDLVTRDRVNPTIVHEMVVDSGAVVIHGAAMSNMPSGLPSSFVDGPLSRVNSSTSDEMVFPVGKKNSLRRLTLLSAQSSYQRDTLRVEMFQESAADLGFGVIQTPEVIPNI